jgi:uncharacterized membrane protein YraQ (UPF0718 family)
MAADWGPRYRTGREIEYAVLALSGLAVLATFLPYYGARLSLGDAQLRVSVNAWHSYAVVGDLLLLAALGLAATRVLAPQQVPTRFAGSPYAVVAALAALGTLLVLARALSVPHVNGFFDTGVSYGVQWGGWLLVLVGAAEAVVAGVAAHRLDTRPLLPRATPHDPS